MTVYYNEFDPKAAAWLRELVKRGHIAPGEVDERSIEDVRPDDLRGFAQCHFFAGIGVWSYALRRAGWADDRPVWTGSCPCQPFSAAGKGAGFADERHLWPAFHHLIRECGPDLILGEQVASKDGLGWFDLVQTDMEATGYACGAVDFCAAGVGAPHIRQRLWWVAERLGLSDSARRIGTVEGAEGNPRVEARLRLLGERGGSGFLEYTASDGREQRRAEPGGRGASGGCSPGGLGDNNNTGLEGHGHGLGAEIGRDGPVRPVAPAGEPDGLADGDRDGREPGGGSTTRSPRTRR